MHIPKSLRFLSLLLTAAVLMTMASPSALAAPTPGAVRIADADTLNDYETSLGDSDSTLLDGRVWSDKSVSTTDVVFDGDAGGITVTNDSDFLVTYSALATSTQIISETTAPVDVVFVLDFSASMAWGQYENGRGTVTTQAESRVQAMVDGINEAISALAEANDQNRVGIVVFNRGAQTMLNLGTVAVRPDKDYLAITRWNATPGADNGNNGNVQVTCNIDSTTIPLDSYTNIHAGIYQGMQMLLNATDTDVLQNGQTVTRVPNLIVMSDGAPTTFSRATSGGEWWAGIENTPIGSGDNNTPHSGNGFLPLVTAAYFKKAVTAHYYPAPQPGQTARVFTIGFKTSEQNEGMRTMADLVLEPGRYWNDSNDFTSTNVPAVNAVNTAWQEYLTGSAPTVQYTQSGNQEYTVDVAPDPYNPTSLNYPDAYFAADDADALWNAFRRIINSITSSAQGPTEVENNDPVHSGYILYVDPIGQYMQVDAVKTILWANVRFDLEAGYVPTPESQPDGGVRYTYTGHFATDSGGKTFDSPVYGRGNVDDILVTVNQDADGNQTLRVAVPASAIPIRVNSVTLNVDGDPVNNVSNNAYPLRVCYTVGLKPGVTNADGTLNTDPATGGVSSEYLAQHTDPATNQVYFYSNLYSGNEEDGETVGNATVEFNPASTNPFYFIQENTPLYLDPACTIRADQAQFDPDQDYYFQDDYYASSGDTVTARVYVIRRRGSNLQDYVARDGSGWYIVADAPRLGNLSDLIRPKGAGNLTQTAQTSFYPTYQAGGLPQGWLNAYQGNNGRLALAAPASLSITKNITADAGLTLPADSSFDFTVSVPTKSGQTVTATRSASGMATPEQLSFDGTGNASFTLQPGETLTIPDMQNAGFTVRETSMPEGFALETATADPADIGSFDAGSGTYTGTMGTDAAAVTFTNVYRASFGPDAGSIRIPVSKTLSGYRDTWLPGETFTFQISPSSRADNNRNAALALPASQLVLSQAMPQGNFVVDLNRLLDADTLEALRQRAAIQEVTPESGAVPEASTAPETASPETAVPIHTTEPTPDQAASPETATSETSRRRNNSAPSTLAGLTLEQVQRMDPADARELLDSIPGVYYYTITETGDPETLAERGVTKDLSQYEAAITVADNGSGTLTATLTSLTRVVDSDGNELTVPEPVGEASFDNRTVEPVPVNPTATPRPSESPQTSVSGGTPTAAPSAQNSGIPQTGDEYPYVGLFAAAVLSACLVGVLIYHRRRKKQ